MPGMEPTSVQLSLVVDLVAGMGVSHEDQGESHIPDLSPTWVRLVQNGTNPGLFQIRFQ